VVLHGEKGPWSDRVGVDEIGAAVSGLFTIEGTPTQPSRRPYPFAKRGWAGSATVGVLEACGGDKLRKEAIAFVSISDQKPCMVPIDGLSNKAYGREKPAPGMKHTYVAPAFSG